MKEISKKVRSLIEASHRRCIRFGITPDQVYSKRFLAGEALFERLHGMQEFIRVAEPFLNHLYGFVKGSDFFVVLTDAEGCILNLFGDEDILAEAFSYKMIPGAFMDEINIGTNAMGTAIEEGIPMQVSGNQHFIRAYQRWTCSAAPIADKDGKLLGILDLTGYSGNVHPHTLGMVVAAANAIERILENHRILDAIILEKLYTETIIDSITSGIIASDTDGNISKANSHAAEMFGYSIGELSAMNVTDLFDKWESVVCMARDKKGYHEEEVTVHAKRNKLRYTLSTYPITGDAQDFKGVVHVFKEIRKGRKQTDRLLSQKAIYTFDKIVGANPYFLHMIEYAKKIADGHSTVLITGESGTGKELFAQSIHNLSPRAEELFVEVHCGTLTVTQMEEELFGFSGESIPSSDILGKVAMADKGTLFLDEIDEMPMVVQSKLLRLIEEGVLYQPDGKISRVVDVRIIATSSRDLEAAVKEGRLRKDLYYRLNVLPLHLPALRDKSDDIPLLMEYFLQYHSKHMNKRLYVPSEKELDLLKAYIWPGNVRELENFAALTIQVESMPVEKLQNAAILDEEDASQTNQCEFRILSENVSLEELEKRYIRHILNEQNGNVAKAARLLGISRNTMYRYLDGTDSAGAMNRT
jgi:PAS domain S-box-containing protein